MTIDRITDKTLQKQSDIVTLKRQEHKASQSAKYAASFTLAGGPSARIKSFYKASLSAHN